ncbi:MAG TPA: DUF3105 domain-containing protein [Solirubrobacteraceae bacterium]|nr:DUF3105 domain-containing protein [Solirubrobacteraceae bacterium]
MASRQEEKERLRQERLAQQEAEARSAARKRRLQLVGGAVAVLAVAGILAAVLLGGGGEEDDPQPPPPADVSLPPKQTDDLEAAAKAAGCTFKEFPDEGNAHLPSATATFDEYKTNPPTSGTHRPPPAASDGIYEPGASPDKEDWVHTLEHGRVIFMYAPGTPEERRQQLEVLMNEEVKGEAGGFKTVIMENNTDMPFAVAAVSWSRYVACKEFTDGAFDALRAFRAEFVEDAPEGDFPWPFFREASEG